MLFGKVRIVGKLALLVFVPLLGVVALTTPIIVNRVGAAAQAQRTSDAVQLASRVGTAVQQLQLERVLSVGFRLGLVPEPELVVQSAKAVDAVAEADDGGQPIPAALRRALDNASTLDDARRGVRERSLTPDAIVSDFTQVVTPIINGLGLSAQADLRTAVGRQVFALDQAMRSDDMMSQAASYLIGAALTHNAGLVGLFSSTLIQIQQVVTGAQAYLTDAQYRLYVSAQAALAARVGPQFLFQAMLDPGAAVRTLDVKTLFPALRSVLVLGGFVEKRIAADVRAAVADSRDSALLGALLIGGGSLVLLLTVVALSILMARAVARPLRRLTVSADRIARAAEAELQRVADDEAEAVRPIRLDPVDVAGNDEIGDLARAFDRVQSTAARLVERQVFGRRNVAQMFGHVGRRTQNLVGRQLTLIDRLERRETDSERLRQLYRLDHLSSRLRRSASALVVLSGAPGADEHMAPLPLADVVRLALAEIEEYPRVDVDVPEYVLVAPAILADLTLLLAELMENATSFSPPQTRVAVTAEEVRGAARLAIVDRGLGLAPERMAEENARLTRRERLDLAPTEVLGLFVVGRLARRHGIAVALSETPGGGVTAWIELAPAHLVAPTAPLAGVLAGSPPARRAPVGGQPFDPAVFARATRTLESGRSWNAFQPTRTTEPAGDEFGGEPVYDAEPVYQPPARQEPLYHPSADPEPVYRPSVYEPAGAGSAYHPSAHPEPAHGESAHGESAHPEHADGYAGPNAPDLGTPVAGRLPAALGWRPAAGLPAPVRPTWTAAEQTAHIPRQRTGDDTPVPGHGPLTRRVPGATLPQDRPPADPPAPTTQAPPDPAAVRAQIEQFEYGVALALQETQPQPEGQPR